MVNIDYISVDEAKSLKRSMKKSPIVEEYESLLVNLPEGKAGKIDAKKEKEKPQTIKNRLIRVGKSLTMTDLNVKRVGDIVSFWRE
ncbi:hypothetical protein ACFLWZ_01385 [Chloroflexota bacterium]